MANNSKIKNSNLLAALVFGIYSSLLMYLGYKMGFDTSPYYRILNYALAIVIVYYAIHNFKNLTDGLSLKQALKIGAIIGTIGGVIYGCYTYFHITYVDELFLQQVNETITNSDLTGIDGGSAEESQKGKEIAIGLLESPFFYVFTNFIGSVIQALIISLVIGLIKKR